MGSEVLMELNNCRNLFPLREIRVLDIGCGQGEFSWKLMKDEGVFGIEAIDADINLVIANQNEKTLPRLNFSHGRAEKLDFEDNQFDLVVLIKSFHHVPIEQMDDALHEIVRVTKPSGHIYISEPLCEGAFNDILVMFYDERIQRAAAAKSIESFIKNNVLTSSTQGEYVSETVFDNFEHFNNNIIQKVTHGAGIEKSLLEHIKAQYETYADNEKVCFKRKSMYYKLTK